MKQNEYLFKANVWLYPGRSGWYFVNVPQNISQEISHFFADYKRGFGSLRVNVTIGQTHWTTSIFRDNASQTYLLPLKAEIRKKEHLSVDDFISIELEVKK